MRRSETALQAKFRLNSRAGASGLFPDFLQKRFEFALFQSGNERGIIRLYAEIVDRHRQLRVAIEFDHFPVLQDLIAGVEQLLARALTLHLVDVGEQGIQSAVFAQQRGGRFRPIPTPRDLSTESPAIARTSPMSFGSMSHLAVTSASPRRANASFGDARSALAVV